MDEMHFCLAKRVEQAKANSSLVQKRMKWQKAKIVTIVSSMDRVVVEVSFNPASHHESTRLELLMAWKSLESSRNVLPSIN